MRDLIILLVHLIATLARSAVCRGRIALGQASTADSQSLAATGAEPPSVGSDPRRCLYAVHAPCLEFLDRGLQLGDGGADIWQLDDISGRCLGELAQPGQFVGDPLFVVQRVGKFARMRPVREMSRVSNSTPVPLAHACYDRSQRIGRQGRRFVDLRPDDFGG